ncbi:MAG: T9SS type A sorting domain-containing protein [Bacteroidota bacterium]
MKIRLLKRLIPILFIYSLFAQVSYSQTAPSISYYTPKSYKQGTAIAPLSPVNTGGTVPAQTYGAVTTFSSAFSEPYQSVWDASGNLVVVDATLHCIKKITPGGVATVFAGISGSSGLVNGAGTSAKFKQPDGIAIDPSGNFYVSDYGNNVIRKITPAGVVSTYAGTGAGGQTNGAIASAKFTGPAGIIYSAGNLYIADQANNEIRVIVIATGQVSLLAGSATGASGYTNGSGNAARFNSPADIQFDASGVLMVCDHLNNVIRSVTTAGVVSNYVGSTLGTAGTTNGNGTAAKFTTPYATCLDGAGNVYVGDYGNNEIRLISPTDDVTLLAGSTTAGTTDGTTTAARFSQPANMTSDGAGYMYIADKANGLIRKMSICGYTISPALPAGLNFDVTTGIITGTPTATSAATDYTITAYNYYGSDVTTLNLAVRTSSVDISDANTAANGITQGVLHPGQSDIVLYGFSFNVNTAMTVSGFKLNAAFGTNGAGFYFTNGRLYKNTSNTFTGATPVSGASVAFSYNSTSGAITITGLSEVFTLSSAPVYYFVVADLPLNFNTLNAASQTMQFKFETAQTDAVSSSTPSANYAPNIAVPGTSFTIAPPTLTVSNNNFTANGITNGSIGFGQTDIVLFSFKIVVDGTLHLTRFDIPCNVNANSYFLSGKIYRSTTPNFSDAVLASGTVSYPSAKGVVSGMDELMSSSAGTGTYYYFLLGDLTNTGLGAGPIQFSLSTATYAFEENSPYAYKQFYPSANITGISFPILTTYKWVGQTGTDFNAANNYKTILNGTIASAPSATSNIYLTTGATNAPTMTANLSVGSVTFDGATASALTLNGKTLTISNKLVATSGTTANITGTGTVTVQNTALTSNLGTSSILNLSNATLNNAGILEMEPTATLNLLSNATVANTGTFRLLSDATGTAMIGPLSGTSSLTGTYIVQRYFTGGNILNRGWRLMSMPVNNSTTVGLAANSGLTTAATYTFSSLQTNLLITGATGGGFDVPSGYTANGPTVLFYSEGTSKFTNLASITTPTGVGTGFYFYFRGDKTNNLTNKVIKSGGVYATPEANVVGLQSGTLNQKDFTYNLTFTGTGANKGVNLVGNPYPASYNVTAASLTNTNSTVYTYSPGGNSVTANAAPFVVGSGEGFYVKATNTGSKIVFTEANKSTTQLTGAALLMGTPANTQEGNIKLRLMQDTSNYDFAQLRFADSYDKNYNEGEDADDLNGNGQVVFFGAVTADNREVAIASQPLDKQKTSVFLSVNDNASGTFKINRVDLSGIPDKYDVWLMDHFKKDSIDLRNNATYTFNMDKANAATFGDARMEVVIRKKVLPPYQLMSFTGKKASNNDNVLNWTTQNEYTYTYFELQRSFDGTTYEGVNNSTSTGTGKYTFSDQSAKPMVYYRLKQTDINDVVTYSTIVIIKSDNSSVFSVYPNPVDNMLQFSLSQVVKSSLTLRVYNSTGTLMKLSTYTTNTGQQDVSKLTPGSYMVELVDDSTKKLIASAKFIKL